MAVTHKHNAASHVNGNAQSLPIGLIQPPGSTFHEPFFSQAILPTFVIMANIRGYASIR